MSAFGDSEFVDTAACGDLQGIVSLLADESFPTSIINNVDKDGRSAFHYSCLNDDFPLLTILLKDARINTLITSPKGDTALHMAALYASLEAIKMLIADGRCNIDAQNEYLETPLHLCAGSGDKGAAKAAKLLLSYGAKMTVTDKWNRGPIDVSRDNAENPLVSVFNEYLDSNPEEKAKVMEITKKYKDENLDLAEQQAEAKLKAKSAIFGALGGGGICGLGGLGGLGGVKLKKTTMVEKQMFGEQSTNLATKSKSDTTDQVKAKTPVRLALSKLIDFPGDLEEIKKHLEDPNIDPAGKDSFGLAAIHKFASWNKTSYLDLIIPKLSTDELNAVSSDGKTALHWAVEMAAVGSVRTLVNAGINPDTKDNKGQSVGDILDNVESSGVIERLKSALVIDHS